MWKVAASKGEVVSILRHLEFFLKEKLAVVLNLVRARCPQAEHIEVRKRSSRGGKYVALTLTFTVYTQQQIEDIYSDLYECEQVVMSL